MKNNIKAGLMGKRKSLFICCFILGLILGAPMDGRAADIFADPADYSGKLSELEPGDTLHLAAGTYTDLLKVYSINGTPENWITITGPSSGDPAVFVADPGPCCNTVEIRNSSYVAIENLTVDGNHVGGAFGLSAKDGSSNLVHNIRIEGCTFINHDTSQGNVAISTKTPTWGWIIRRNRIIGAGTGMYLGNSPGTEPFVNGLIEYNYINDTMGYNMQIKWQSSRPDIEGMPEGPVSTIIRHNVFVKNDRSSPSGDRPNVLVGGFPDSGPGSEDLYEIYGNLFYYNSRESLIQASGRLSIHDNIFVDVSGTAIRLQNHDLPMRMAHVYNNTIYEASTGIYMGGDLDQGGVVVGNLIFASTPISGSPTLEADNITDTIENADLYVANPTVVLGEMDFYPLASACEGPALDLSLFAAQIQYDRDFNGHSKGDFIFRGAYAGSGENPGWVLDEDNKPSVGDAPVDGGVEGDASVGEDATAVEGEGGVHDSTVDGDGSTGDGGSGGGCSCRQLPFSAAENIKSGSGYSALSLFPERGALFYLLSAMFMLWAVSRKRPVGRKRTEGQEKMAPSPSNQE